MTRLSKNFPLSEFIASETAKKEGLSNMPTRAHMRNLYVTAFGLEMVRAYLGNKPLMVSSGYRNPQVNAAVGGVEGSAHASGFAADVYHSELDAYTVCKTIAGTKIPFDQLIYEKKRGVMHISFDPRLRLEVKSQPLGPGSPVYWGILA